MIQYGREEDGYKLMRSRRKGDTNRTTNKTTINQTNKDDRNNTGSLIRYLVSDFTPNLSPFFIAAEALEEIYAYWGFSFNFFKR